MSTKNDPAFPTEFSTAEFCAGLTKLEWFAGRALQMFGIEQEQLDRLDKGDLPDHKRVATICFDVAEAMLAESERRSK